MRTDDDTSYTTGSYAFDGATADFWNYGIEIWCNREG